MCDTPPAAGGARVPRSAPATRPGPARSLSLPSSETRLRASAALAFSLLFIPTPFQRNLDEGFSPQESQEGWPARAEPEVESVDILTPKLGAQGD